MGVYVGVTLGQALAAPGTDSVAARVSEWARAQGLGFVVTGLEQLQYDLHPPKVGGTPDTGLLRQGSSNGARTSASRTVGATAGRTAVPRVPVHAALTPVASPALPGEGVFRPVVTPHGMPAVQVAYLRPDASHTSYLAAVAWMSSRLLRFVQHPGYADPGHLGLWSQPDSVSRERAGLVATFNSGFKMADSRGGYYDNGHTLGALRAGAASFVVYRDGHVAIGAWGRDVSMARDVVSVRQNLRLIVEGGRPAPNLETRVQSNWGATLGGAYFVWRSGVGITATGDLVYVTGNALSAHTLADLLRRAGAVRAMELDINPAWISYMWYAPASTPGQVVPTKILPFARPADRYLAPTSRDFVAVYAR
ncbi:MAG TPA: phosphodiester glycosidase family protein [Candidatus Eisenbacteria bacterium]|nr:phosphodiester glycosidase family protein [Candidatus Eisenbacteria bacterium]